MNSNPNTSQKIKLKQQPFNRGNSYLIKILKPEKVTYVPKSVVQSYTPATLVMEIETWWLMKNSIPFT